MAARLEGTPDACVDLPALYPETCPLVPLDSTATGSNCPTSKSLIVRLEPSQDTPTSPSSAGHADGASATAGASRSAGEDGSAGSDAGHKSTIAPDHLS